KHTQDKTFEAIRELQFFLQEYPDSEWSAEVHELLQECFDKVAEKDYRIGNLYYKLKDWEAARLYFGELLETYPMSNWASRAQYEIADSYAREGKYREAIEQFEIFIQSYPENERSAEAGKRLSELREAYEVTADPPGPADPADTPDPLRPSAEFGSAGNDPASTDGSSPVESESGNSP
ncbi:MAG: outer membrane protein assembly factor BamD, partial [Gemmatimonadetes bacterium]|nr:outer membrane protein assembly factor BamD [Gemmatimonadota bacterium]